MPDSKSKHRLPASKLLLKQSTAAVSQLSAFWLNMMLCPVFLRSAELPSARNWFQTAVVMAAVTICWVQALWQLLSLSKNIWKTAIPELLSSMVVLVKKAAQPKHLWHVTASGKNWTLL